MAVAATLVLLLTCCLSVGAQSLSNAPAADTDFVGPSPTPALDVGTRADLLIVRKRYQDAFNLLQDAIREGDKSPDLYNRLGIAAEELRELKVAEHAYKQAIHRNPRKAEYYNNLGTVYYSQRKWGKALKWYKKALKHANTVASFYVNAGMAEFSRRHYEQAMKYFRSALVLDPNALFPESNGGTVVQDLDHGDPGLFHFNLARLFCSLGNMDDAMHQFRMALDLHYPHIKDVYRDPAFAPLLSRSDFVAIMKAPQ